MILTAVLGAGAARRFGAPKLLLPAGAGETVLSRVVRMALSAVDGPVLVLCPAEVSLYRSALAGIGQDRLEIAANPHAAEGLASSVRCATRRAMEYGALCEGILFLPGDQPVFPEDGIRRVLAALFADPRNPAAAAASPQGLLRAPAAFAPSTFEGLLGLQGDRGAQALLRGQGPAVAQVPFEESAFSDLDDFRSYRALARREGWSEEQPKKVAWHDVLPAGVRAAIANSKPVARVGAVLAYAVRGESPGGHRATDGRVLPGGGAIVLWAGTGDIDQLKMLRCAALWALRVEE